MNYKQYAIKIPMKTLEEIEQIAERTGFKKSEIIRGLIFEALERRKMNG